MRWIVLNLIAAPCVLFAALIISNAVWHNTDALIEMQKQVVANYLCGVQYSGMMNK